MLLVASRPHSPGDGYPQIALVMKNRIFKCGVLMACMACGEPAIAEYDSGSGGFVPGGFESGIGAKFTVDFSWGEQATRRIVETQTMLIRHKATEYQRRVAEQNAKAFFKTLTPEKKTELKKKKITAVLIPTVRSAQTSPKARDVRMRYSLEGESLIDDYAYEFAAPLQAGTIAKTEGLEPEYVGQ
jgi:hypothetical protein